MVVGKKLSKVDFNAFLLTIFLKKLMRKKYEKYEIFFLAKDDFAKINSEIPLKTSLI